MKFVEPLTEAQREELEALRRAGATHRQRDRAHAVLLSAQGYPIAQLAVILGVERDAVGRWCKRLAGRRGGGADGSAQERASSPAGRPGRRGRAAGRDGGRSGQPQTAGSKKGG